jgi:lysozyme
MDATMTAVDLIVRFEGRRLAAYKDPSGVATIGYGTTVYPTGAKVRLGDEVSGGEAKEYLAFDCAEFARGLTDLLKDVQVGQNQFDALVSFAYNIGLGAFQDSTMLKKLKAGDVKGAAKEFPRWNKATVKGIKQVLPGLVKRRAAERTLFETTSAPAPADVATKVGPPPEPDPTSALLFEDAGVTVVVLLDKASHSTNILQLPDQSPASMAALTKLYPSLKTFVAAPAGTPIPPGERWILAMTPPPVPPVAAAPKLNRPLLARGSVDSAKFPGNDVHQLQARLKELGYYTGPATGTFDAATENAAKAFQADYFGEAEANGHVGPKTWAKLFPVVKPGPAKKASAKKVPAKKSPGTGIPGKNYLRLTKTPDIDKNGLRLLKLEYVKDGKHAGSICTYSGLPSRQRFHKGKDSQVGSLEPLPEGRWVIHDVMWKDGTDNYNGKVWNKGLGPAKIPLDYDRPGKTARGAIEIHIDWNRSSSPGTAGCLGVRNVADYKTLVTWLRDTNPSSLFVDWGLGSCPKP